MLSSASTETQLSSLLTPHAQQQSHSGVEYFSMQAPAVFVAHDPEPPQFFTLLQSSNEAYVSVWPSQRPAQPSVRKRPIYLVESPVKRSDS